MNFVGFFSNNVFWRATGKIDSLTYARDLTALFMLSEQFFLKSIGATEEIFEEPSHWFKRFEQFGTEGDFSRGEKGLKYILTSRYHVLRIIKVEPMLGFSLLP